MAEFFARDIRIGLDFGSPKPAIHLDGFGPPERRFL